jgi:8-oxo-dGTP pyrophosphatase MutT (NUDIX family)
MGAGILPTCIHHNKLYFLFGKENKYEKSAPGFSDFGGGSDNNEKLFSTAVREAGEELTGFLGSDNDVMHMLKKHGTYNIDIISNDTIKYRTHIFPFEYDPMLPFYYNNNQKFLQKKIPDVIKKTTIFEKQEIRWVCIDDIMKMKPKFRFYFRDMVNKIYDERNKIKEFILHAQKYNKTRNNRNNRNNRNRNRNNKTRNNRK